MAIRTSTSSARSSSYSTQKAPQKSSSAQRSGSTQRASTPTQSRQTSSAPRRDTFTYSSPTEKQTAPKTSTAKTSTASKSSQAKTSAAKSNTTAKTSSSKTVTKAKSNPTASKAKCDSFEFSSEAVKKSVQSAKSSKSSANSKATTKSSTKNSANAQTKKAVKSNSSNKNTVSGSASKSNKSSKNKVPEGLKLHLQHTKDPKQKAGMRKTAENIAAGKGGNQVSKKLKALGIDLTTLTFMSDGSKYGAKIIENGQSYEIVPEGDIRLHERGYMTEQDYDKILYIVAHEVGSESINNTEKFATASALINQLEQYWGNGDTIADGLDNFYNYNSCRDDGGIPNIPHEQCIYSREEDSNALKNNVKPEVDLALQGIRAFDKEIQSWLTLDGLHEKYGTNLDVGGKYIINKK